MYTGTNESVMRKMYDRNKNISSTKYATRLQRKDGSEIGLWGRGMVQRAVYRTLRCACMHYTGNVDSFPVCVL